MALPAAQKAELVDRLLASLDDPKQAEIDAAWAAEAEDRVRAHDAGKMPAIAAKKVLRSLRSRGK
ncbi:MAG TPA: addiction module protein [Tepidisphaeraceae bacterium]|nr:addiction module protein [Tepidisphaeraceae bacterium]